MEEFSLFIEEPKEEKEEIGTGTLQRVSFFYKYHPLEILNFVLGSTAIVLSYQGVFH